MNTLKVISKWLWHQLIDIRWKKILTWYWWAYGIYLVCIGLSYMYRGIKVPGDGAYFYTGFYVLFAGFWFALLMMKDYWSDKLLAAHNELHKLDSELQDEMQKYIEALTENINLKDKKIELLEQESALLKAAKS